MSDRTHGTRAKYVVDKCRCAPCKQANRDAENHRYRQQAYGRWEPYVDAEPARAHVRNLMDYGLGWKRIAEIAGVGRGTVEKLLYGSRHRGMGPSKGIRPETACKLLAVQPQGERLGGAVTIDGTGTRRRLQALVAMGWPQARLAAQLGMQPSNFGKTLRSPQVLMSTERAVRALYDQLWREDPAQHGATAAGITRARKHAADNGWPPVGAWDDDTIDDPQAAPWTDGTQALNRDERAAARREEIEHLIGFGLSEGEIAQRLGMDAKSVRVIAGELQTGQRRERRQQTEPKCGEPRMYRRHLARGETPCDACRAANTAADRRYRLTGTRTAA